MSKKIENKLFNRKIIKDKKAQVSIFIIIGIIMIIVSIFLFSNGDYNIFVSHDSKLKNQISDIVKNCIEKNTKEGVFLLGFQGGYININLPKFKIPGNYIDMGFKIPTWDSNKKNNVPTIKSMENELNNFIQNNSNSCIRGNLKEMNQYFNISIDGNLSINSTINPENVIVQASMPITFNEKNSKDILSVQDYYVNLDTIKLGSLYNLATKIYNFESSSHFLENLVIDQIESASDYSHPSASMPSEGMSFSCAPSIWTIPLLKKNLANLNNHNFKYLQFTGTFPKTAEFNANFNNKSMSKQYRKYYDNFYTFDLGLGKDKFSNFKVDINMPSTEVTGKTGYFQRYPYREFKVKPSSGQIVKPSKLKIDVGAKIPIPCIQIYHTLYSLDYDLVVTLTDMSPDGNNYQFRFPLRVVIKKNNPKVMPQSPILREDPLATNDKFCSNESRKYNITVFATDKNTKDTLSDVNISYKCITLQCDLGTTKQSSFNGILLRNTQAKLNAKFPYCSGGTIIASKNGYADSKYIPDKDPYQLKDNSIAYYELSLIPTKEFVLNKFSFYAIYMQDRTGHRIYKGSNESVYISIENKKENFESSAIFPSSDNFNKLKFLKGDYPYNISIIYVDGDNNLRGMYEKNNVILNPENGNNLRIVFPSSKTIIGENSYKNFYDYMTQMSQTDKFGIFFK